MRFDEPDVRDAYKQGVRDCLESALPGLKVGHARKIKKWLEELQGWQDNDAPPPPPILT